MSLFWNCEALSSFFQISQLTERADESLKEQLAVVECLRRKEQGILGLNQEMLQSLQKQLLPSRQNSMHNLVWCSRTGHFITGYASMRRLPCLFHYQCSGSGPPKGHCHELFPLTCPAIQFIKEIRGALRSLERLRNSLYWMTHFPKVFHMLLNTLKWVCHGVG